MPRKSPASIILLAAVALLLAACGALTTKLAYSNASLAYRNLPPLLTFMVDDYVDMHGNQKEWVRDRMDRMLEWHRANQLPEYRRFLEHVLAKSREPFTAAEIGDAYRELRVHYKRTVEHALPDVAEFIGQLDSEQVAQMEKKLAQDNRKLVRELGKGDPAERLERRVKKFMEHLDTWLGEVSPAQRALVEAYYRDIPELLDERMADRKIRQAETLALVRARASREQTLAGLRRLLIDTETWRRPDYLRKLADRDERFFRLFAELSRTFTPEQRAHLQKRIRGYMNDITKLVESGPGKG